MRKLRSGEGRARARTHTSRHPVQGSSFHSMGWISPPPTGLHTPREGQGQAPNHAANPASFHSTQRPLPVVFNVCGLTPPQGRSGAREGVLPLELLKTQPVSFRVTSRRFGLFQLGSEPGVPPGAVHFITRKDILALWQIYLSPGSALHPAVHTCLFI